MALCVNQRLTKSTKLKTLRSGLPFFQGNVSSPMVERVGRKRVPVVIVGQSATSRSFKFSRAPGNNKRVSPITTHIFRVMRQSPVHHAPAAGYKQLITICGNKTDLRWPILLICSLYFGIVGATGTKVKIYCEFSQMRRRTLCIHQNTAIKHRITSKSFIPREK